MIHDVSIAISIWTSVLIEQKDKTKKTNYFKSKTTLSVWFPIPSFYVTHKNIDKFTQPAREIEKQLCYMYVRMYICFHIIEDCCENGLNVTNVKLFLRLSYLFLIFLISPYPYMFLDSEKQKRVRRYFNVFDLSIWT